MFESEIEEYYAIVVAIYGASFLFRLWFFG